jgi:hypothetical protein
MSLAEAEGVTNETEAIEAAKVLLEEDIKHDLEDGNGLRVEVVDVDANEAQPAGIFAHYYLRPYEDVLIC